MTGVATESVASTANWFDALASIVGFTRARWQVLAGCRRFAGRGVVTGRAHTAGCTPASAEQHDAAGIIAVADAGRERQWPRSTPGSRRSRHEPA